MRIYRVIEHTVAFRWYHFPTLAEAKAFGAQLHRDLREEFEAVTVEIEPIDVKPTRAGIAEALDDFVSLTCINEH